MSNTFNLDGAKYRASDFSQNGQMLLEYLKFSAQRIQELNYQITLLNRSKNGYISDLKTEIFEAKSGIDLGSLFEED